MSYLVRSISIRGELFGPLYRSSGKRLRIIKGSDLGNGSITYRKFESSFGLAESDKRSHALSTSGPKEWRKKTGCLYQAVTDVCRMEKKGVMCYMWVCCSCSFLTDSFIHIFFPIMREGFYKSQKGGKKHNEALLFSWRGRRVWMGFADMVVVDSYIVYVQIRTSQIRRGVRHRPQTWFQVPSWDRPSILVHPGPSLFGNKF